LEQFPAVELVGWHRSHDEYLTPPGSSHSGPEIVTAVEAHVCLRLMNIITARAGISGRVLLFFFWAILTQSLLVAAQVSLPPVNLGLTSFEDAIAFPGWLVEEIPNYYHAGQWKDAQGNEIPGVNELNSASALTHVAFISNQHVLGGFYAVEALVSVANVHPDTSFGPNFKTGGIGDLIFAPLGLQWTKTRLARKPFFQRVMFDVVVPTGKYSNMRSVNIGSNVVSFNPYYAFTFVASDKLEISARLHYLWNSKNDEPFWGLGLKSIQPGQALHQNFAVSYGVAKAIRIGMNGYALEQITDNKVNGISQTGSLERVIGLGPGTEVHPTKSFWVYLNSYFETAARNRPEGLLFVLRLSKTF